MQDQDPAGTSKGSLETAAGGMLRGKVTPLLHPATPPSTPQSPVCRMLRRDAAQLVLTAQVFVRGREVRNKLLHFKSLLTKE